MISNVLIVSTLLGVAAANYGNVGNYGYRQPNYGGHPWHRGSSSSSESNERWDCSRVRPFNVTDPSWAPLFSAPKIAYFTRHGEEKAIIVCDGPQLQVLVSESTNANPDFLPIFKDFAVISLSSRAGIVLDCNERNDKFEAFNLFSKNTVQVTKVACVTGTPAQVGLFFNAFQQNIETTEST